MAEYSIRDIARLAGVSVGTVSRILNNAENVDAGIRERTLEVIRRVGYQARRRGRHAERSSVSAMRTEGRAHNIALLSPGMSPAWQGNDLWASYMDGIEAACRERGGRVTLYMADIKQDDIVREISRSADGILIKMEATLPDYAKELLRLLPAVGFGAMHSYDALPQVVIDNHAGGMIAAEELMKLGHRRIAFVNHQGQNGIFIARSNGYLEVLKSAGCFRPEYLLELPGSGSGSLIEPETAPPDMTPVLDRLLNLPERPTAVIVGNDWGAVGFLRACETRGIRVPDDLSLVGMDDSGQFCTLLNPALSSAAMPFNRVSHFACCTLCDLIDGVGIHQRNTASIIRIPGEFHARASIRPWESIERK